ncbi:hypothetical protein SAMN04488036_108123 [Shimia haliotis]|uniref:Alpha/beta hydrolase family protein n=1 Tax=Shimia haliotis TaxID=1280847 RepID=A0A1I4GHI0_9RHOB|nr:hypothetical protein SAMN04488036_108123 [Shimia haliotis]
MRPTCLASDLRLLVVGDIFGRPARGCCLSEGLSSTEIIRCDLANLSGRPDLAGEALHAHLFERGAMGRVVDTITKLSNTPTVALGYSAGGTALWQAARHVPFLGLVCISSTRLRNETPVSVPTLTVFGGSDPHRPNDHWCATVPTHVQILPEAAHDFYCETGSPRYAALQSTIAESFTNWHRA